MAGARQAAGAQARRLQEAALDGEQLENDLIAGGLRLDQATMAAVRHAVGQLEAASASWDRVTAELGKHAQGEEYAASGHAASTGFLGSDGGSPPAAEGEPQAGRPTMAPVYYHGSTCIFSPGQALTPQDKPFVWAAGKPLLAARQTHARQSPGSPGRVYEVFPLADDLEPDPIMPDRKSVV